MVESFEAFFEVWLIRLERHLQDLLHAIECKRNEQQLIHQTISLYGEYFVAKSKVAQESAFLVVSPTWFTSLERAHLWIGGFMPSSAFRLVSSNVLDLTEDQSERIGRLMEEIKAEEKQVYDEFTTLQDWMVSLPIIEMAMQLRNGEESRMDSAFDGLKMRLESVVECADYVRKKVVGILALEILKPDQAVTFLAAAATSQLRLRRWGMHTNDASAL